VHVKRLLLVGLVACGSADPTPVDCSTVSAGVKKYWEDRAKETTDVDELAAISASSKLAAEKLERHCRADQWNEEMIKCTRVVFRLEDSGCTKHMSQQQKARFDGNVIDPGVGVSCVGCDLVPSTEQCDRLLRHLVTLELANAKTTKDAAQKIIDDKRTEFLATCTQKTPKKVVECALAAQTLEAVGKCE
jgi:hypothetical protein